MRLAANNVMHRYFPEKPLTRLVRSDEFKVLKIDGFDKLRMLQITLKNVLLSPAAEAFRNSVLEDAEQHK